MHGQGGISSSCLHVAHSLPQRAPLFTEKMGVQSRGVSSVHTFSCPRSERQACSLGHT